jgi:ribosomal protein S18 acetylase RimI-like enzyme
VTVGDLVVERWEPDGDGAVRRLSELLAGYHLQTEAEKGLGVDSVAALPERYRAEVADPARVLASDTVMTAACGGVTAGCVVLSSLAPGVTELKRLWVVPAARGRAVASALVDHAVTLAAAGGASTVRLSVWEWRSGALALYRRRGFAPVPSWDGRDGLVCMELRLTGP